MDFLKDKIKPMYLKYLTAAFGSAIITSIYSGSMSSVGVKPKNYTHFKYKTQKKSETRFTRIPNFFCRFLKQLMLKINSY